MEVRRFVGSAALVTLMMLVGCDEPLDGELRVQGEDSSLTFVPTKCASGDHADFFGVDLIDDDGNMVRLTGNDNGPAVSFIGVELAFRVESDACDTYRGEMNATTSIKPRAMEGRLELDCTAPTGEHIKGEVEFRDCHDFD